MIPDTKYGDDLECASDLYLFYPASRALMPVFRRLAFTPNGITALSTLTIILAIYFLTFNTRIAAGFFIVSYILDCADGMFARKYNLTSALGMAFDYIKDGTVNPIFYVVFLYKYAAFFNLSFGILAIISLLAIYFCLVGYGINEAIIHLQKHADTDYLTYRKGLFNEKSLIGIIYLAMCGFFYKLVEPYLKNPNNLTFYVKLFKFFGQGNLMLAMFIIMNVWKL